MDVRASQCDRCPAIAKVKVTFDNGLYLFMCGHHEREFFPEDGAYEGISFQYDTMTIGGA